MGLLWSQIVRLQIAHSKNLGPQVQLMFLRQIPDSAQVVDYALDGNIEGLKDLFKRGLASPRDVSVTRGYSVLRVGLFNTPMTSSILTWFSGLCMGSNGKPPSILSTQEQIQIIGSSCSSSIESTGF